MSRTRPVLTPVLLALLPLLLVTACGAGLHAQTLQPYSPGDGVATRTGDLRLLNVLVVADGSGSGVLSLTIVNEATRDNSLTDITSPDGTVDLTGTRDLPAGRAVRFGAETEPSATITDLKKQPGQTITLKLTFARVEPITVDTVVVPAKGFYASLTPGPGTPVETTEDSTGSPSASPS